MYASAAKLAFMSLLTSKFTRPKTVTSTLVYQYNIKLQNH